MSQHCRDGSTTNPARASTSGGSTGIGKKERFRDRPAESPPMNLAKRVCAALLRGGGAGSRWGRSDRRTCHAWLLLSPLLRLCCRAANRDGCPAGPRDSDGRPTIYHAPRACKDFDEGPSGLPLERLRRSPCRPPNTGSVAATSLAHALPKWPWRLSSRPSEIR
jgi:hypothetical protein